MMAASMILFANCRTITSLLSAYLSYDFIPTIDAHAGKIARHKPKSFTVQQDLMQVKCKRSLSMVTIGQSQSARYKSG